MPLGELIRPHHLMGITDLKLRFNWRVIFGSKQVVLEDQGVVSSSTMKRNIVPLDLKLPPTFADTYFKTYDFVRNEA